MAETTTKTVDKSESTKEAEDKKITALRKTYDEVAKKVTDASKFAELTPGAPAGYADLRAKKAEAAKVLHDAEDVQGKRIKAENAARREGRPPTP